LVLASVFVKHETYGEVGSLLPAKVEELRKGCKTLASDLIASSATWEKVLADDTIWILATEAEARLLQEQWEHSAELYKAACAQPGVMPFHRDSMRKQVVRIVEAFGRLGVEVGESFAELDTIFGPATDG
jgi:hypothetical protein